MTQQYERISYYQRRASAGPGPFHMLNGECSLPPITDVPPQDYEDMPVLDVFISLSHSQSERVTALGNLINSETLKRLHGRQAPISDDERAFFRNYEQLPAEGRAQLQQLARHLLAGTGETNMTKRQE